LRSYGSDYLAAQALVVISAGKRKPEPFRPLEFRTIQVTELLRGLEQAKVSRNEFLCNSIPNLRASFDHSQSPREVRVSVLFGIKEFRTGNCAIAVSVIEASIEKPRSAHKCADDADADPAKYVARHDHFKSFG
jgi:hypothetical protein